jgi:hypothetical protein
MKSILFDISKSVVKIIPNRMNLFCGLSTLLIGCLATSITCADNTPPKYRDIKTVSIPTQTAQADWHCENRTSWLMGNTCLGWIGNHGNFSLDWSPPDAGWVITGLPTLSKNGSDDSWVDPVQLSTNGTPIISKDEVTEAFRIAIRLADLENKPLASTALKDELSKRLASNGLGDSTQNTLHVSGGCKTTGSMEDRKACNVSVTGTVVIMYVGNTDGLELLASLMNQYGL